MNERRTEGGEGEGSGGWRKESECYARPHWGVQNLFNDQSQSKFISGFCLLSKSFDLRSHKQ